ncbi:Gfo/Idh/MocA family protein [Paenibacillus hubeiensis]|uniref:Gfo/Idh/MocA family protein n=1 Tax=Paenibacillus hubeiensis TaxID=3077330 RepID=UPI0031BA75E4
MNERYRVIVAGCGAMSGTWVDYAMQRPDTAIVGLVDLQPQQAAALAGRHGLDCPTFTDINEAIAATGANIVFDVTIPSSHYNIAKTALRQGCHVFGEKPLAETISECRDIVRLSGETGQLQAVMQNRRFDPRIRAYRSLIADGTIGKVGYAGADFFLGPHFGGFREIMDSPLLLDMAIHTFDQARFILGADPVSVYCHEFNPPGSWYKGHAMALCIFEMSDGSVFNYRGSWCAEGAPTSWEASWRVIGEKGSAIWNGHDEIYAESVVTERLDENGKLTFFQPAERIEGVIPAMDKTGHHGCLEDMFDALETGRLPETHCSDNQYSMAMVLGSLESARIGQKVWIADLLGSV